MLAALESAGMSESAFAREVGVGLHRVRYWRQRLRGDDARPRPIGFVPIRVRDTCVAATPGESGKVEVELSNGRRLRFSGSWTATSIAPWLRALEEQRC